MGTNMRNQDFLGFNSLTHSIELVAPFDMSVDCVQNMTRRYRSSAISFSLLLNPALTTLFMEQPFLNPVFTPYGVWEKFFQET